jgi:hypothetical protein
VVINHFDIGDWKPDASLNAHHRELSLFIIPAWVEGTWKCVVNHPDGRYHMTLRLHRRYQRVWGAALVARREIPIADATLVGRRLNFTVAHPGFVRHATRFNCDVDGAQLAGTCRAVGGVGPAVPWGGVRV